MASYDDQVAASQYAQYTTDPSSASTNGVTAQTPVEESIAGSEAQPQQSDLERYWDIVKSNPDDFTSWEYLIRVAETAEGGLTPQSPQENITNMRNVFDQFLAKFPLCFGYWKKYADFEFNVQGPVEAEKIYERSVAAIANSVDLWTQYCAFKIEHYPDNVDEIRGLFERGASCVGLDFLSHLFWDKYIEFEKSRQAYDKVLKILERIIRIPMHQYARFFDDFTNLCGTRPINELISPEQHQQFEEEVKAAPPAPPAEGTEGEQPPPTEKTEEQIQNEIRTRIYNLNVDVYMKTQTETNKRWIFEQEIKRPYFHVKAMDDVQLINWRRYLDFEETEGDEMRIQVLFERCLVACALYEEFWLRYARWMISKDRISDARSIYDRAISVFIPMSRPNIRTSYACFEEQQGNIEVSRSIYKTILDSLPGHVETIVKYAHFERRRHPDNLDLAIDIITSASQNDELDDKSKAFLAVQHAKILWHNKGLVEEARKIFQQGSNKFMESKYFWLNYFNFESSHPDPVAEKNLREVYDLIHNTAILPPESIRDFSQHYLDFLMERGSTIASYNKVDVESNGPVPIRVALDTKKRGPEEDPEKPAKQMRVDSGVDNAGTSVVPAASYTAPGGAQPPYYTSGQWGTPGYTAYPAASTTSQTPYPYPYQYPQTAVPTTVNPAQAPTTTWDYTQQSATGY